MSLPLKRVDLFTDGACLGNPGTGGWAALLRYGSREKLLSGGEPCTTNNRMELKAALEGLLALREACQVHLHTDSQYLKRAFAEGWVERWQRNGWRTAEGKPVKNQDLWQALLKAMEDLGVALDLSHLADEALFPALEAYGGPVCATHANARALTPTPRHLSDEALKALAQRGGVLGLVPFNAFLDAGWKRGMERLPLAAFLRHKAHAEAILGPRGVGLGTDWDGGFGLEALPQGLDRHRDLWALGDEGFLGGNWLSWLLSWF